MIKAMFTRHILFHCSKYDVNIGLVLRTEKKAFYYNCSDLETFVGNVT